MAKWIDTQVSCAILAGGLSRRMGSDKAELLWNGMSFLNWQLKKAAELGCQDLMISGNEFNVEHVRTIPDIISRCGPLGGMYSCFLQAHFPNCLVISVDTPCIPLKYLKQLVCTHLAGDAQATLLKTNQGVEPLIGVYRCETTKQMESLIKNCDYSVQALLSLISTDTVSYTEPSGYLMNCNTPEDYQRLCRRDAMRSTDKDPF
ncbi:MAG: molybdenum cofactor guanylyltransferase [Lawsonibacter sp.]|nr:molybdenum cofactor guanylyltransferase [Lawsonibacter sp.]